MQRDHHGQRLGHERGRLDHVGPLVEVGHDDLHHAVVVVQVPEEVEEVLGRHFALERQGQVAYASVDELGASAAGPGGEIIKLDLETGGILGFERFGNFLSIHFHGSFKTTRRSIHRYSRARCTTANDKNVENL